MIKKIAATPYNARETIGWALRNVTGFSGKNAGVVNPLESPHCFNERLTRRYRVAVMGDILPMRECRLALDARLQEFLRSSDCLIGDFEGIITGRRPSLWPIAIDQRHNGAILEDLGSILAPARTYLSVSNNHSGDFGEEEFLRSVGILESAGFRVFGWADRPFADINDDLRVVGGTMWSNRPFALRLRLDNAADHVKRGAYNILYGHMGYELELYPRPETAALAERMAGSFDAVIAAHPHCPQPVTAYGAAGVNKVIAYSLGNFCFRLPFKTMRYGLVMIIEVGRDAAGRWAAGLARWLHTECVSLSRGRFTVRPIADTANPFIRRTCSHPG